MNIERKIRFYCTFPDADNQSRAVPLDLKALGSGIDKLDDSEGRGRYLPMTSTWGVGQVLLVHVDDHDDDKVQIQLAKIRRRDLPLIEKDGDFDPLALEEDEGLAEPTHLTVFKSGIVGIEYNHNGPRIGHFRKFLKARLPQVLNDLKFNWLLNEDASERLSQLESLKTVELQMNMGTADIEKISSNSIFGVFDEIDDKIDAPKVSIILGTASRSESLSSRIFSGLIKLFQPGNKPSGITKCRVRGRRPNSSVLEDMDLLEEHAVVVTEVIKAQGRSRAIDSDAMFAKIEEAYESEKERLISLSGIST